MNKGKLAKKLCIIGLFLTMIFCVGVTCHPSTTQAKTKNGIVTVKGKKYYYKKGKVKTGWVTIKSGKNKGKYYFLPNKKGRAAAGLITIKGKKYYFDKKTNKLVTDKLAVKVGSKYYQLNKKGVATKISEVEGLAGLQMEECGRDLYKAFVWASENISYLTIDATGMNVSKLGLYGFKNHNGDCNVQAAVFYWLAKSIGKDASFMQGYVTNSSRTFFQKHAWCTVDGKVYDVNFVSYVMRPANGGKTEEEALALSYGFIYEDSGHFHYCDLEKNSLEVN